jgi:hypothetical protein
MSTAEQQRVWRARHGARSGTRGRPAVAPCGTLAAHKRHVRHGEVPCDLCRLAARSDRQFRRVRGSWQQSDRFAWLLHRAVLDELLASPDSVLDRARARIAEQRVRDSDGRESALWVAWQDLIDGLLNELAAVLLGSDESAKLLRSTTPFVGIVGDERRAIALRASKAD